MNPIFSNQKRHPSFILFTGQPGGCTSGIWEGGGGGGMAENIQPLSCSQAYPEVDFDVYRVELCCLPKSTPVSGKVACESVGSFVFAPALSQVGEQPASQGLCREFEV